VASLAERLLLSQAALDISLQNPLFGVGSANFIPELSKLNLYSLSETRLLQPVHNVFLLIMAENGIIGLLIFSLFLLIVSKYLNSAKKVVIFLAMLFYFSVDHFLWTLQQGQLIFWFLIAFLLTDEKRSVK
jgi:O-antigen ligase